MEVTFQPVRILLGDDADGRLVFAADTLVGVLVCLSELHGEQAGTWFLEAGFGRLDGAKHPVFPHLQAAQTWVADRLRNEQRPLSA